MIERLTIARLGHRGDGVVEAANGPIYVPYALPGEQVTVEPMPGHSDRRRLIQLEKASHERTTPICKHFGQCGGCALQHWSLAEYHQWKRRLIIEALAASGVVGPVAPLIDAHGRGRRRAVLHARRSTHDLLEVGFVAPRAHHIVPVDTCPILVPELAGAIAAAWAIAEAVTRGSKPLDIHVTAADNGMDVDLRGSGCLSAADVAALARVAERHKLARLTRHGELVAQRVQPLLQIGRAGVPLPPGSFLQATAEGEETLARLAIDAVGKARHVADLFCGVGSFALRLAERARVTAADSDLKAIDAIKTAAAGANRLKPVEAVTRDLFRRPYALNELKRFDAVIFDPSRQGAEAQAREIAKSTVPQVVAVSCDAATFARDAKILAEGGYRIASVTPVDQFRYSPHVEIVGVFER